MVAPPLKFSLVSSDDERITICEIDYNSRDTKARECYAGNGMFRLDPKTEGTENDQLLTLTEWADKASAIAVDSILEYECFFPDEDWFTDNNSDELKEYIIRFLDNIIKSHYEDKAKEVVEGSI